MTENFYFFLQFPQINGGHQTTDLKEYQEGKIQNNKIKTKQTTPPRHIYAYNF